MTALNRHHRRAVHLFTFTAVMVVILGVLIGMTTRAGAWHGMYCTTGLATTDGCDLTLHGWQAYSLAEVAQVMMVPLWTAVFSFITAGLAADDRQVSESRIKRHVEDRLAEHRQPHIIARIDALNETMAGFADGVLALLSARGARHAIARGGHGTAAGDSRRDRDRGARRPSGPQDRREADVMQMWSLTFRVGERGTVEIAGMSDGIPPGEFEIRGHDDGNRVTLNARQRDLHGRFVVSAHHTRDRAEEALGQAEGAAEAVTGAGGKAVVEAGMTGEMTALAVRTP